MDQSVRIAVIGITGAGKSTLIRLLSGRSDVEVGHSLDSRITPFYFYTIDLTILVTSEVKSYSFSYQNIPFVLVGTPGFNDTVKSDLDILNDLIAWLEQTYRKGTKLHGIIYLHKITDIRMQGTDVRSLIALKKLCGENYYSSIVLGTTFWDTVDAETGVSREKQLCEGFWGDMIKKGAKVRRISSDRDEGMRLIMEDFAANVPHALQVQEELVNQGFSVAETSVRKQLENDIGLAELKHQQKVLADDLRAKNALKMQRREEMEREQRRRLQEQAERDLAEQRRVQAELEAAMRAREAEMERQRKELAEKRLKDRVRQIARQHDTAREKNFLSDKEYLARHEIDAIYKYELISVLHSRYYKCRDLESRYHRAMRIGWTNGENLRIENMIKILQCEPNLPGVPTLIWNGWIKGKYRVAVIQNLGQNLDYYILHKYGGCLPQKLVGALGRSLLGFVKKLHEKSYICGHLSPSKISIRSIRGNNIDIQCYTDLEYATIYRTQYCNHNYQNYRSYGGSKDQPYSIFASRRQQNGDELSRKDDMESLAYVLIYASKGYLPWHADLPTSGTSKEEVKSYIAQVMDQTSTNEMCDGLSPVFGEYLNYARNMDFYDQPDYQYVENLFWQL